MSADRAFGRYRVLSLIAAGGMGEVYRAAAAGIDGVDKPVALKVVRRELAADPQFARLFIEEAKVALTLSHANVVQAFDVGRIDDRYFLALELVSGIDAARLIEACVTGLGQPVPARHALFIAVEALKGIDYAHRKVGPDGAALQIVHRDISPANLLLSLEGEVKVADFGVARSTLHAAHVAGEVRGKVKYMAPEQLRGAAVDRRADVYSVGVVLYELLTGRRPFDGDDLTVAPLVLGGRFQRPAELVPGLDRELEAIVLRAMATEPADRFQSAAAMRQRLEELALERKYLLSSNDLAELITEARAAAAVEGTSTASGVELLSTAVATPRPLGAATGSARAGATGGFDALLGVELARIDAAEPLSVFTSTAALGVSPVALQAATEGRAARPGDGGEGETPTRRGGETDPGRRRSRVTRLTWLGGVVVTLAAVALVASSVGRPADRAAGTSDAAPAPEIAAPSLAPAPASAPVPRREASADPAPPPGPPPGLGRLVKRLDRRNPALAGRVLAETGTALLSVNTDPWSFVTIDGVRIRTTPLVRHPLSAGRHTLRFHHPPTNLERVEVIEVRAGQSERLFFRLGAATPSE